MFYVLRFTHYVPMNPRLHNPRPAIAVLTAFVAGCVTAPQPVKPPEFHVAQGFVRNTAPPAVLQVHAYAGIRDWTEEGEVQAKQDAIVGATYMAKMAADPRGLRFLRVDRQMRLADAARSYSFGIAIPEMRYGGATVAGTAIRSRAVLTQMARLDLAEVTATLTDPTAETIAQAIQRCYWEAILKFATEKYSINPSGTLQGNITIVDLRIAEGPDTMAITMQVHVQLPKRKRAAKPRGTTGKKQKWKRSLDDLPPEVQERLRSHDTSPRRTAPRRPKSTPSQRKLPPEMEEALKRYKDGKD